MPLETQRGRTPPAFGAAIAALLAFVAPARAAAQSGPGEGSPPSLALDLNGEECGGNVPSCRTVRSPVITVSAGQYQRLKLVCGDGFYFWNWAAETSPQVVVHLTSQPVQDAQNREVGAIFGLDEQSGARAGSVQISVGCSPEDPAGKLGARRSHFSIHPSRRR